MEKLKIEVVEDESEEELGEEESKSFLENLKDALAVFDGLPLDKVVNAVQSEEYRLQREEIQSEFWKIYDCISKDDDSLDSAILMQEYGFTLSKPKKEKYFQN
jgi:hypothetical protein